MNSNVSVHIEVTEFYYQEEHKSYKGLTGFWSKWGGRSDKSVVARQDEEIPQIWYCQSCRTEQPMNLPPYFFKYDDMDFIRVCAVCINNGCEDFVQRRAKEF